MFQQYLLTQSDLSKPPLKLQRRDSQCRIPEDVLKEQNTKLCGESDTPRSLRHLLADPGRPEIAHQEPLLPGSDC